MVRFLAHCIGDKRVVRLIIKWLNAGVMEAGQWWDNLRGAPQGSVIGDPCGVPFRSRRARFVRRRPPRPPSSSTATSCHALTSPATACR